MSTLNANIIIFQSVVTFGYIYIFERQLFKLLVIAFHGLETTSVLPLTKC